MKRFLIAAALVVGNLAIIAPEAQAVPSCYVVATIQVTSTQDIKGVGTLSCGSFVDEIHIKVWLYNANTFELKSQSPWKICGDGAGDASSCNVNTTFQCNGNNQPYYAYADGFFLWNGVGYNVSPDESVTKRCS